MDKKMSKQSPHPRKPQQSLLRKQQSDGNKNDICLIQGSTKVSGSTVQGAEK